MERVIKFRAWEPIHGMHLPFTLKEISEFRQPGYAGGKLIERVWMEDIVFMQFTGLLDKNWKEIYEGDILKFFDRVVAVVVWQDFGGWSYKWVDQTYINIRQYNPEPFFRNINLSEVAGNIYENPELQMKIYESDRI